MDNILANRPEDGELWVFAFGSLIWKPRFIHDQRLHGRVDGWQRSFCMGPDTRYRGNPDQPGYMLSLVEGGQCEGVVFRMDEEKLKGDLLTTIQSEPPIPPIWLDAQTPQGSVRCIGFVCPQSALELLGKPTPDEKIRCLATGVGMYGSMPDYVLNTVQSLQEAGIHDPYLWEIQEKVANYLKDMKQQT